MRWCTLSNLPQAQIFCDKRVIVLLCYVTLSSSSMLFRLVAGVGEMKVGNPLNIDSYLSAVIDDKVGYCDTGAVVQLDESCLFPINVSIFP